MPRDDLAGLGEGAQVAEGDRLEGQVAEGRGLHRTAFHGKAGGVGSGLVQQVVAAASADHVDAGDALAGQGLEPLQDRRVA
jgi:hypothetical protein